MRGGSIAAAICMAWAAFRGGNAEKFGALLLGAGWVLTAYASKPQSGPGLMVLLIDIAVFLGFTVLSIRTKKLWTSFAAAMMLISVALHVLHILSTYGSVHIFGGLFTYATMSALWGGWGPLACLASGIITHQNALKRAKARAHEGTAF